MNSLSSACRRDQGFALAEFLVVLVIVALVFSVTLPAFTGGSTVETLAAARTVAAGLRQTRDRAITSNQATIMEVDVERKQIMSGKRLRQLPQRIHLKLFTAKRERLGVSRGAIRFFPDGSSTGGRVTLIQDNLSYLVDIDWLTGRIVIRESSPDGGDEAMLFERVRIE